ncbi:CopG family transcriptional regulator [Sporosarcina cyprini]|uniref:CopG family transcriptional regulator n=1 Tax=Sporosarcina cyprini TaxID=2910523 RepID=UPI001EDD0901|nr:CopG family transcriptional regulator [Sporosarcina cyprini]MCG3088703.1 CopG family transcriptional regulator [Sporosarcina cyprini]
MVESEKITINMNVVDLGKVDLLVEQGFYSNRTDFIRTSIRNQLATHAAEVQEIVVRKSFVVGVMRLSREDLVKHAENHTKIDIKVVGLLILDNDIDVDLAQQTIASVQVNGVWKASAELKAALS